MTNPLAGRSVVITGGGTGIGRGIAGAYARGGASVLIAEIDKELGERAAEQLREQYNGRVEFVRTDVTDRQQVHDMVGAGRYRAPLTRNRQRTYRQVPGTDD